MKYGVVYIPPSDTFTSPPRGIKALIAVSKLAAGGAAAGDEVDESSPGSKLGREVPLWKSVFQRD